MASHRASRQDCVGVVLAKHPSEAAGAEASMMPEGRAMDAAKAEDVATSAAAALAPTGDFVSKYVSGSECRHGWAVQLIRGI